jgi:hypothetical protein
VVKWRGPRFVRCADFGCPPNPAPDHANVRSVGDVFARQPCLRERKLEIVGRFTVSSPAIGWQRLLIFRDFWIDAANVSPPGGLPIIRGRGCEAAICRRNRDKRGQGGPAGSITSALRSLRGSPAQQGPGGVSRPRLRVQDAHEAQLGIRDRATERDQLIFDHGWYGATRRGRKWPRNRPRSAGISAGLLIRALRAGRSRRIGAFSLHRSHGSVRCRHPRNPQTLSANVWVSLPGRAKSTAGAYYYDCRQGDRSVVPGFVLSSPLPAVSSQRPRLGTPASAPTAQTSALRCNAPDASPRTRHPHLFSFRGHPNRVTCRFIAFPVEPHRAKKNARS